ncbi:hypothetical protein [Rhizobium leucaenae]|uniref:Type I secretion protein n=1 Tax=Rhizobium leucaenae TaxID=29450 RepID=A0A7W7EMR6_9HYPH|nr:hypothetical protein [Rhizobium leucaenae]MBB4569538.1 hypothetical protein [Rhizobium leucaenae]MBB6299503.1 hypothetical protein [Rhizobium leucaenae]
MHAEKISEIIAHFIGLFDTQIEDLRLRLSYTDGTFPEEKPAEQMDPAPVKDDFASGLTMVDYAPNVKFLDSPYYFRVGYAHLHDDPYHARLRGPEGPAPVEIPVIHRPADIEFQPAAMPTKLEVYMGPGSETAHVVQANVLRDDDVLDMTNSSHHLIRDVSDVYDWLGQATVKAEALSPLDSLQRTESTEGMIKLNDDLHAFAKSIEDSGGTYIQDPDGSHYLAIAGNELDGIFVNGVQVTSAPYLEDSMPDRGPAAQKSEIEGTDGAVHQTGQGPNSLNIEAGSNIVANLVNIVDTNVISHVMAVMGDYHSIDAISQSYIYSDNDKVDGILGNDDQSSQSALTIGRNIAVFQHSEFQTTASPEHSDDGNPAFPSFWRVSVIEGDVSFLHWTEQYNFLSDNDTMRVTTTGAETTLLTGGNTLVDLASYFGLGMQYDLMIVGGHAFDINSISQISVLYDNDVVSTTQAGEHVQTGGNLLWNLASINNVGLSDRFTTMPDFVNDTVKNIQDHTSEIPDGLAHDPNFAGQEALNVLYITGNFFDVNVVKQINVVGDSDIVHQVANDVVANNQNATVSIDTGSNALVNIASITDYDSVGHTTYLAGNLYSDTVLIQGGLVDHDQTNQTNATATQQSQPLANEAIAFLGDHDPQPTQNETIDLGHDMSWHNGTVGDVMQTMT